MTGATSGIGLASVLALARRDLDVYGTARTDDKAAALEALATRAGVKVVALVMDVRDAERCTEVIEEVSPDILVNNAGVPVAGAIEDVDDDAAREALETMVLAPARLARLCAPQMAARGGGRIVNVSSVSGFLVFPMAGWYAAAKQAMEAVTTALRYEMPASVKIVLVRPGGVRTPIWDRARGELAARGDRYDQTVRLLHRGERLMVSPDRVARVVVRAALAPSPRTSYLVGADAWLLRGAACLPLRARSRLFHPVVRTRRS